MGRFSNYRDDVDHRIAELRSEIAELRKEAGRGSSRALADTRGTGHDIADYFRELFYHNRPVVRRGARRAIRTVEDHPAATTASALIGLGLIGILAYFLLQPATRPKRTTSDETVAPSGTAPRGGAAQRP